MLFFNVIVVSSALSHCSLGSPNKELNHALHCLNHGTVCCLIEVISLPVDGGVGGVLGLCEFS